MQELIWAKCQPKPHWKAVFCIEMDLAQGSVRGYLELWGQGMTTTATVPSSICHSWAVQLLRGCAELHRQNCVHRDIKPDNVLVFLDGAQPPILKIADLGMARELVVVPMTREVCTTWYRAPEVFDGGAYGSPVDMWSAGCTIVELFSGYFLFPGKDKKSTKAAMERVLKHHMLPREHPRVLNGSYPKWTKASESSAASGDNRALKVLMGEDSPPNFVSVAVQCLRLDPGARISAADALCLLEPPTLGELEAASQLPEREPAGAAAADEAEPLVGKERSGTKEHRRRFKKKTLRNVAAAKTKKGRRRYRRACTARSQ